MILLNNYNSLLFRFSQGTGVIHYGSVTCDRTDTRLIDCTTTSIAAGNCDHSKDLAITCSNQRECIVTEMGLIDWSDIRYRSVPSRL